MYFDVDFYKDSMVLVIVCFFSIFILYFKINESYCMEMLEFEREEVIKLFFNYVVFDYDFFGDKDYDNDI